MATADTPSTTSVVTGAPLPPDPSSGYVPYAAGFLCSSQKLHFPVLFKPTRYSDTLIDPKKAMTLARRKQCLEIDAAGQYLYVQTDELTNALPYAEDTLPSLAGDLELPVETRARAFHNCLTLLVQRAFSIPDGVGVYRIRTAVESLLRAMELDKTLLPAILKMAYDRYTIATHCVNCGFYGLALARELLKKGRHDWIDITTGCFIHDIGKTKVSEAIMNKEGGLDQKEWWEMKRHPSYGENMLENGQVLTPVLRTIILLHHERMDGRGYPLGLRASAIPLYARMMSVVDAYDALTTQRVFRDSSEPFDALKVMKHEMASQFDPDIFRTFVLLLNRDKA